MQTKLEVLEQLKANVIATREADKITNEETEELDRIAADIEKAIQKEREEQQIQRLDAGIKQILQDRLDLAFKNDISHTKELSKN